MPKSTLYKTILWGPTKSSMGTYWRTYFDDVTEKPARCLVYCSGTEGVSIECRVVHAWRSGYRILRACFSWTLRASLDGPVINNPSIHNVCYPSRTVFRTRVVSVLERSISTITCKVHLAVLLLHERTVNFIIFLICRRWWRFEFPWIGHRLFSSNAFTHARQLMTVQHGLLCSGRVWIAHCYTFMWGCIELLDVNTCVRRHYCGVTLETNIQQRLSSLDWDHICKWYVQYFI